MYLTNIFLIIILVMVLTHCFQPFASQNGGPGTKFIWGDVPIYWHNNLNPPYSYENAGNMYIFNPGAYRK